MIYIILGLCLLTQFIITWDYTSALSVIIYIAFLRITEAIMHPKCNPNKCPYYTPIEGYDAYKREAGK